MARRTQGFMESRLIQSNAIYRMTDIPYTGIKKDRECIHSTMWVFAHARPPKIDIDRQ